jgi:4-amino-4-deoxy-L-arabinose transferase-like glycosyltransferase
MNRKISIGLFLAVAVAAGLRFYALGAQSVWVDEAGTVLNVCFSKESIAHFAFAGNNSPPLYFWCVAPFTWLFGPTEFGVRFLSALCGVLSIPLLYFLVLRLGRLSDDRCWLMIDKGGVESRRDDCCQMMVDWKSSTTDNFHSSTKAALIAAWLLAINPLHLWFSQEARCYSLLLFLTLSSLLLFLRAGAAYRPIINFIMHYGRTAAMW